MAREHDKCIHQFIKSKYHFPTRTAYCVITQIFSITDGIYILSAGEIAQGQAHNLLDCENLASAGYIRDIRLDQLAQVTNSLN